MYIVCKFGNIWSSNPGDYKGRNCNIRDDSQDWLFPRNITESTEPIVTKSSDLVDLLTRMINLTLVLRSSKGHCYSNQLIFGTESILDGHHHHSAHSRFNLNWNIATPMHALTAAMMPLHGIELRSSRPNSGVYEWTN